METKIYAIIDENIYLSFNLALNYIIILHSNGNLSLIIFLKMKLKDLRRSNNSKF
jgi:hypothetical protein